MSELTKKQIINYKIDTARLIRGNQSMYISEVIAIPIIMQTRWSQPKTKKSDLGFNKLIWEQSVVIPLLKTFSAEKIKLRHKILENERIRTDMYFSVHKFVVEIEKVILTEIKIKKMKDKQK